MCDVSEELLGRIARQCESAKALAYEQARRAEESGKGQREQLENASRLHFAVSTVLYATLCILKVGDLETLLSGDHSSVPRRLFDLGDYEETLESARGWRILESKRLANRMFHSEFAVVYMATVGSLRERLKAVETENRRELTEMQQKMAELGSSLLQQEWQEQYTAPMQENETFRRQAELLVKEIEVIKKEREEEAIVFEESLRSTEEVLALSSQKLEHLESSYAKLQREAQEALTRERERHSSQESRTSEALNAAMARIKFLEEAELAKVISSSTNVESAPGPVAMKAALHAKNSTIEEQEKIIAQKLEENVRLNAALEQANKQQSDASVRLLEENAQLSADLERALALADKLQSEVSMLHGQQADLVKSLEDAREYQAALAKKFSEKDEQLKRRMEGMSRIVVIKLQARVRGYRARAHVDMLRIAKHAEEEGILIALKPTIQGMSGWYMHPDGNIYCFALRIAENVDDEVWIQTCGPVSSEAWSKVVSRTESTKPSAARKMLSVFSDFPVVDPRTNSLVPTVYMENGSRALFSVTPLHWY
jgi:hypothetical protein